MISQLSTDTIAVICNQCKVHRRELKVDPVKLRQWQDGELIQNCFPNMSSDDREMMISHTCPECWDKMMKALDR